MSTRYWTRNEIIMTSKLNQHQITRNYIIIHIDIAMRSNRNHNEITRYHTATQNEITGTAVQSQWNNNRHRDTITMTSLWNRIENKMTPLWNHNEITHGITMKSQGHHNEITLESQGNQGSYNEITMKSRWHRREIPMGITMEITWNSQLNQHTMESQRTRREITMESLRNQN